MKKSDFNVEPYDPCPCGSGKKYKFCCAPKAKKNRHGKHPVGTVVLYGPDEKTTTKIAAGVNYEYDEPILRRWVAADVTTSPKVLAEIRLFFAGYSVKEIVLTDGNLGCPHEEGIDFGRGEDCPLCPFWAGKQGTARRDDVHVNEHEHGAVDYRVVDASEPDDEEGERDWEASFARIDAILGDADLSWEESIKVLFMHLKTNIQLPCRVTGIEDFRWEEKYVIGGWSPVEYRKLKKTCPSYKDEYELVELTLEEFSNWMMHSDEVAARVERVSDGKRFILGLSELEPIDENSPNSQLLEDYSIWLANY